MEKITNSQLMEMMDIVSSSPELRERVERRIQSNRRSKKAYNAKAYAEKKKKDKAMKLLNEAKAKAEASRNRAEEIKEYNQKRGFRLW